MALDAVEVCSSWLLWFSVLLVWPMCHMTNEPNSDASLLVPYSWLLTAPSQVLASQLRLQRRLGSAFCFGQIALGCLDQISTRRILKAKSNSNKY